MKKIILFIGIMIAAITLLAQGKVSGTINEVENSSGTVYVNLYTNDEGFPSEWSKAYKQQKLEAKEGQLSFAFENLPFGTYAISIAHDENENGEVDTNFIGFPKEPVGASNLTSLGKPSFNRSKFELSESNPTKTLKMNFIN